MESVVNVICYSIGLIVIYKICDRIIRFPRLKTSYRRNIIVTGCDSGFGCMFTKRMDRKGYRVFSACLTEEGRLRLDKETSERVIPLQMDIADERSIRNALNFVASHLLDGEGIWALVNNAGTPGRNGPVEWLERADFQEVFNVNILGTVSVCQTFLPLIKKCRGRIINTSSIVGRVAVPAAAPYCASKFAIEGFSDTLRREMKSFGVSVHIIEPGGFKTPINSADRILDGAAETWNRLPDDLKKSYGGEESFKKVTEQIVQGLGLTQSDVTPVINSYEHAVTARYPRARYMPGWTAWALFWPVSLLPEWISDKMLRLNLARTSFVN